MSAEGNEATRYHHRPDSPSGEFLRDAYHRTSRGKEGLGASKKGLK